MFNFFYSTYGLRGYVKISVSSSEQWYYTQMYCHSSDALNVNFYFFLFVKTLV